MPYKIAIDLVFFSDTYSGITRVWETLLNQIYKKIIENSEIIEKKDSYEIILLIRGDKLPQTLVNNPILKKYKCIQIPQFSYMTMNKDVDILNFICTSNNINLFITTYYTYCTNVPNLLLIHDMIPEITNMGITAMWKQKELAIKNASAFICISNTTKSHLLQFYPHIELGKIPIYTIYNSIVINETYLNTNDEMFYNNIMVKNGIKPASYIFSIITNNEDYKNIKLMQTLNATHGKKLSALLNTPIPIIVLCKMNIPNNIVLDNNALYITNVPTSILNTLYNNALCYVSASKCEGFGLPVFEAFSHKLPVIVNDIEIYRELCNDAVHYINNDVDELFNKVCIIHKEKNRQYNADSIVYKKIQKGAEYIKTYSLERQIAGYHQLFLKYANANANAHAHTNASNTNSVMPFLNIMLQSYNETDTARYKELEYCIRKNLENPYIAYIHDFGFDTDSYLAEDIIKHPKYISVQKGFTHKVGNNNNISINPKYWLKYVDAFTYSNTEEIYKKYGIYWGLINCDIYLDTASHWNLIKGWLNRGFCLAQSRHELRLDASGNPTIIEMDTNFAKLLHCTTQDGWFYAVPFNKYILASDDIKNDLQFEIGFLGCDNAIANRMAKYGFELINKPITFKIVHYDLARQKTSENFMEKHREESSKKEKVKAKPKNTQPEKKGCTLVPNFDNLLENNCIINLNSIININNLSNLEIYKIIMDYFSSNIYINN